MKVPDIQRPPLDRWKPIRVVMQRGVPSAVELDGEHFRVTRIVGGWRCSEPGFCGGGHAWACSLYPTGSVIVYADTLHGDWYVRR